MTLKPGMNLGELNHLPRKVWTFGNASSVLGRPGIALPPQRHFSEGLRSRKNFLSSVRARNTPTPAWGLLVIFGTPNILPSLLILFPGWPRHEQIQNSAVGQRPPRCS